MYVSRNSLHKRIFYEFSNVYIFAPKSREVTPQNRLYLKNLLPESDFFATKRRRIDVRRVMPSFMSISAMVQELFLKNRGGRDKPPRRLRVNPRPAVGAYERPPSGLSRIAKIWRRAAPPGFHPPDHPCFPQLLCKFRPKVMQGQVTRQVK